jgi:hypothetical protein
MSCKRSGFISLTLLVFAVLLASIAFTGNVRVYAEQVCTTDNLGANDLPGQKDVTKVCLDDANAPESIDVTWNWDDAAWTGENTGDACVLFDAGGDGLADSSVCVVVGGDPADIIEFQLYSCENTEPDRCTGAVEQELVDESLTRCSVSVLPDDPFDENVEGGPGADYPYDTVAECTFDLRDLGGANVVPIDVCSYPSNLTSAPSDCVVQQYPTAVTLIGTPAAAPDSFNPAGPLAAVAAMLGLMFAALAYARRRDNGQ